MATLTKPSTPGWKSVRVAYRKAKGSSQSPFTFHRQVYLHPGEIFSFALELPPIKDQTVAAAWITFLRNLAKNDDTFKLVTTGYVPSGVPSPMTVRLAESGNEASWDVGTAKVFGISFTVEQVIT